MGIKFEDHPNFEETHQSLIFSYQDAGGLPFAKVTVDGMFAVTSPIVPGKTYFSVTHNVIHVNTDMEVTGSLTHNPLGGPQSPFLTLTTFNSAFNDRIGSLPSGSNIPVITDEGYINLISKISTIPTINQQLGMLLNLYVQLDSGSNVIKYEYRPSKDIGINTVTYSAPAPVHIFSTFVNDKTLMFNSVTPDSRYQFMFIGIPSLFETNFFIRFDGGTKEVVYGDPALGGVDRVIPLKKDVTDLGSSLLFYKDVFTNKLVLRHDAASSYQATINQTLGNVQLSTDVVGGYTFSIGADPLLEISNIQSEGYYFTFGGFGPDTKALRPRLTNAIDVGTLANYFNTMFSHGFSAVDGVNVTTLNQEGGNFIINTQDFREFSIRHNNENVIYMYRTAATGIQMILGGGNPTFSQRLNLIRPGVNDRVHLGNSSHAFGSIYSKLYVAQVGGKYQIERTPGSSTDLALTDLNGITEPTGTNAGGYILNRTAVNTYEWLERVPWWPNPYYIEIVSPLDFPSTSGGFNLNFGFAARDVNSDWITSSTPNRMFARYQGLYRFEGRIIIDAPGWVEGQARPVSIVKVVVDKGTPESIYYAIEDSSTQTATWDAFHQYYIFSPYFVFWLEDTHAVRFDMSVVPPGFQVTIKGGSFFRIFYLGKGA